MKANGETGKISIKIEIKAEISTKTNAFYSVDNFVDNSCEKGVICRKSKIKAS